MTLKEAQRSGIQAVRKPFWNPTARLELPPEVSPGICGPWCKLYDTGVMTEITFWRAEDGRDDWEAVEADPAKSGETDTR